MSEASTLEALVSAGIPESHAEALCQIAIGVSMLEQAPEIPDATGRAMVLSILGGYQTRILKVQDALSN